MFLDLSLSFLSLPPSLSLSSSLSLSRSLSISLSLSLSLSLFLFLVLCPQTVYKALAGHEERYHPDHGPCIKNYEATLRRMCNKSAKRGSLQVSPDVAEKWKCTKARKQLIVALINCQGDKATGLHNMQLTMCAEYLLSSQCFLQ